MAEAPLKASKEVKDATAVSEDSTDATAATEKHTFGPSVHISKHPVLLHKISILRSANTPSGQFRSVLREITYHLGYEATAGLTTRPIPVSVSAGKESPNDHLDCTGDKLIERVAVVPILRSGLGMSDSMLELLPKASVYHIGMYRIPGSAPVQYFNRLPRKCASDAAIVLDPVIASAQTSLAAIAMLKKWGVPKIHLVSVLGSCICVPTYYTALHHTIMYLRASCHATFRASCLLAPASISLRFNSFHFSHDNRRIHLTRLHALFPSCCNTQWGVPKIHLVSVLGSSEGLATIEEQHPDVQITVGTVDSILTKDGIVLPGLGDAGDRLFGCVDPDDHDESLLHPSKRSRTA
eukprot:CAMPEP_0198134092 /NCGR_PEP_ID=MMETSP1442-20131203/59903_1 /TAXON_ID= /ORGANISM="Craspedostauros australis, Strain CCMP3328" /LENGTH=351 /DNA_ID=CAMNT_0043795231 /DNA_START=316 /DNA_END=1371 /DNA_ORIENTATION=-